MARLRTCLTGAAKGTVAALLSTACDPELIMNALDQCYGRPEIIIDKALEEINRLPRPGYTAVEINQCAIKVPNIAWLLKSVNDRSYTSNGALVQEIVSKRKLHYQTRWTDYGKANSNEKEPILTTLSKYLLEETSLQLTFNYSQRISADNLRYNNVVKLPLQEMIGEVKPQLLIGADNWHLIVSRKLYCGKNNEPFVSLTRLGWIYHGTAPKRSLKKHNERILHCMKKAAESDVYKELLSHEHLEAILKQSLATDALGINNKKWLTSADARAVQLFNRTIEKREWRYYLGLPWKTGWDEEIPTDHATVFKQWLCQLESVKILRMPRWYNYTRGAELQLHVFYDASEQAKARVAYWRIGTDVIDVRLIAKAWVAPIKPQNIPRLKQAALIGARLAVAITEGHRIKPNKIVLWTDSTTMLQWIRIVTKTHKGPDGETRSVELELKHHKLRRLVCASLSYLRKASHHRKVSLRGDCYGQRTMHIRKLVNEAASQMLFYETVGGYAGIKRDGRPLLPACSFKA
ncbi:uncharacterized protein LOC123689546 [Pieris rapae]|uniref:uncharacterized protein LOC123689546 n=1 Tax=Pieris rapae TaxID=64459 RepID=UPI001E27A467|nr:uncharacterized protein LOC123689546 [Pieris rapae]